MIGVFGKIFKTNRKNIEYYSEYNIEVKNIDDSEISKDLDNIVDFLKTFEPYSQAFKLQQSRITMNNPKTINDTLAAEQKQTSLKVSGYITGHIIGSSNQQIVVSTNEPSRIIHEYGHFIDKHANNSDTRTMSMSSEFLEIYKTYLDTLNGMTLSPNERHYLMDHSEAFALIFEQWCKDRFPELPITQKPTSYSDNIAKSVYESTNAREVFDQFTKPLHINLAKSLSELQPNKQL